jgi:hypothetical protein
MTTTSHELVVLADEGGHEGVFRPLVEIGGRRQLLDHAVIEDGDPVRHGQASDWSCVT